MKNLKVIKTQEDYQKALAAIDKILAIAAPTPDHLDELELLSILVEDYESKTMPVDLPDPIEAIKFRMEQDGLTRKDLQKYIGSASKVSEVLNRKVDLSLKMMRLATLCGFCGSYSVSLTKVSTPCLASMGTDLLQSATG